jgi:hypothetical protein
LVKGGGDRPLQPLLRQLRAAVDWPSSTMVKIDLDPHSFY